MIKCSNFLKKLSKIFNTIGAHRLWSHRAYKANLGLRIFLAIFQTLSVENDIFEWCRDHRMHHKYTEKDGDPHNASRGFFFAHMGWLMCKKHSDIIKNGKKIDMTDLWNDPVVRFQRRFYIPLVIVLRIVLFTLIPVKLFNETIINALLANSLGYVLFLHHTWFVNSGAHMIGYRTYDETMQARDNRFIIYLTLGEGYHNYHHSFPYDYAGSEYEWHQSYNPTTAFLDFCAYMGWAYDLNRASTDTVNKRIQRTGRMPRMPKVNCIIDTLGGIITVMIPFILGITMRFILKYLNVI